MAQAFSYPEAAELPQCALLAVDMQFLPFLVGAASTLRERGYWQTDQDWYRACEAISSFLECSMSTCLADLMQQNDRLYRLLDSGLNGTVYTAAGDPVVVSPSIADVPGAAVLPGLVARIDHVELMLDSLPGTLDPGWFGIGGNKATIADIVRSLRIGDSTQATEAIDSLQEILGASGDIATIGDLVVDALSGGVETLSEGGMLIVLAAGIVGNLAAQGAIVSQLTSLAIQNSRIIQTLDGGTLLPPGDNILQAIRGDLDASETRNVIDSIVAALATITVDDPDALAKLEEIRLLLA